MNQIIFLILLIIQFINCDDVNSTDNNSIEIESKTTELRASLLDSLKPVKLKDEILLDPANKTKNDDQNDINNSSIEIGLTTNSPIKLEQINNNSSSVENKPINNNSSINDSSIEILITRNSTSNYTITKTEIKRANYTLLSSILLRMHNLIQYSANISSQAVVPYVYLAKMQMDGLYRQVVDSTYLQDYANNMFNLLTNDLMNQECNVLSTALNYLIVPIAQTHSSNYLVQQTRELADEAYRWHNAVQRWSSQLSTILNQIAELRFEGCGQKLLCSLGKAKYQAVREEPRMNRASIIQFLNNLFNMPMLEKRIRRNYLEARQYGASGGNCEQFNSNCAIPTENFDNFINILKQFF